MIKRFAPYFTLLLCALLAAATVSAQQSAFRNFRLAQQDELAVDYARFRHSATTDSVRLEVYYQFYNSTLTFEQQQDAWSAEYDLTVAVNDKDGRRVDAFTQTSRVAAPDQRRAKSSVDYRTNQVNFVVEPGDYQVEVTMLDVNSNRVIRRDFEVKAESFDARLPVLSDIELVTAIGRSEGDSSTFTKGGFTIIPSLTGRFSPENDGRLVYYIEVYEGSDDTERLVLESMIERAFHGMQYRDSLHLDMNEPILKQLREISINELPPGEYELVVTLRGRRDKKLDEERSTFFVNWTQEAILAQDFEKAVRQLSYIADPGELEPLKQAETQSARIDAFNNFWEARDPTPGSAENETKQEFYRRIQIANNAFSYLRVEGWRTDRGRIYIMYGEPDQVDDYPIQLNTSPYQEWHYYRSGRYRKFIFVDENEDGEYRLRYPYDGLYQRPDF